MTAGNPFETKKVAVRHLEHGTLLNINQADFDPLVHERVAEKKVAKRHEPDDAGDRKRLQKDEDDENERKRLEPKKDEKKV